MPGRAVAPTIGTDQQEAFQVSDPLVSVIIPIRNEEAFIRRSLGAVLSQDYPTDCMEILIADGMSDDQTLAIIDAIH
ncbi:MAG: glycosyltransferase, partial [Anaerolineae bacterium]|nr:glycosyltransferase [Anaerolineae bacterium]